MKLAISCASGTEAVVKRELYRLGLCDGPALNGRIQIEGGEREIALANLHLRSANRVYIVLADFKAQSFDELFDNIYEISWEDYLPQHARIEVLAKCYESTIHAISVTQSITKKAICKRLFDKYNVQSLDEDGERYKIEVAIYRDFCTVSLDTSGEGLHKRGYRKLVGEAPLKETLASAIIDLSVWNPSRPFADIFCGSGTFVIEGAMRAKKIPSGYYRDFDFLHWKNFDKSYFENAKKEASEQIVKFTEPVLFGYDIDDNQLALAERHGINAGVCDAVSFQKADMRNFRSEKDRGVVFANPPYGERLSDRPEIEALYRDYGKVAKRLQSWCFYTLTPVTDFEYLFGRKADKKRKLYNGNIECFLYSHLAPKN